jgi:hypothetical protein
MVGTHAPFWIILKRIPDSRDTTKESSETGLNISSIYLILAAKLCQADGFRQFCLISEIMELMLRSKVHNPPILVATLSNIV